MTAAGATLINSFISETTENAENMLVTQKLETIQTMKPLSHETPQTLLLKRHSGKCKRKPLLEHLNTVPTSLHTNLKERKIETQQLAKLVFNVKHESD